jgi:hypothetical protein
MVDTISAGMLMSLAPLSTMAFKVIISLNRTGTTYTPPSLSILINAGSVSATLGEGIDGLMLDGDAAPTDFSKVNSNVSLTNPLGRQSAPTRGARPCKTTRTAVTRLALAQCTVPQIAAITGHSLKDVEAILEAHYLGGTIELAEAAITKLNAAYST